MANLNKVMLIGRLTRDPETRTFASGGKVASFGFAVNNRKKGVNGWEDEPVFLDVSVFNRGEYKMADLVEQSLFKGRQVYIEGRLQLDQWTGKDGEKKQKLKVIAEAFQYLDPKQDAGTAKAQPASAALTGDDEIPF